MNECEKTQDNDEKLIVLPIKAASRIKIITDKNEENELKRKIMEATKKNDMVSKIKIL